MDPIIGGALLGAGSSLIGDVFNTSQQAKNRKYMKWAQRETWRREDSAVQRRVSDLKAAGLSPTLAAGSAASTSSAINPGTVQTEAFEAPRKGIESAAELLTMRKVSAEIGKTQADARAANANATMAEANAKYADELAFSENWRRKAESHKAANESNTALAESQIRSVTAAASQKFGLSKAEAELVEKQASSEMARYYADFAQKGGVGYARTAGEWIRVVQAVLQAISTGRNGAFAK